MNAPHRFATIWRADCSLARCTNCGAQQQFHGRPNFLCTEFRAETIDDVDPQDLCIADAYRALVNAQECRDDCCRDSDDRYSCGERTETVDDLAAKHEQRAADLREHLIAEIEAASGLSIEQLREVLS